MWPVEAVQAWLAAAEITEGALFRRVRGRQVLGALSPAWIAQIVKRHVAAAGLDLAAFAGHSLRSGFLTSSAEAGASVLKMVEVSRLRASTC